MARPKREPIEDRYGFEHLDLRVRAERLLHLEYRRGELVSFLIFVILFAPPAGESLAPEDIWAMSRVPWHQSAQEDGFLDVANYGRTGRAYYRSCFLSEKAEDCVRLGYLHRMGHEAIRDHETANLCFQLGCERRAAAGCILLGHQYASGNGVPTDLNRARELYQTACELGRADGCTRSERLTEISDS